MDASTENRLLQHINELRSTCDLHSFDKSLENGFGWAELMVEHARDVFEQYKNEHAKNKTKKSSSQSLRAQTAALALAGEMLKSPKKKASVSSFRFPFSSSSTGESGVSSPVRGSASLLRSGAFGEDKENTPRQAMRPNVHHAAADVEAEEQEKQLVASPKKAALPTTRSRSDKSAQPKLPNPFQSGRGEKKPRTVSQQSKSKKAHQESKQPSMPASSDPVAASSASSGAAPSAKSTSSSRKKRSSDEAELSDHELDPASKVPTEKQPSKRSKATKTEQKLQQRDAEASTAPLKRSTRATKAAMEAEDEAPPSMSQAATDPIVEIQPRKEDMRHVSISRDVSLSHADEDVEMQDGEHPEASTPPPDALPRSNSGRALSAAAEAEDSLHISLVDDGTAYTEDGEADEEGWSTAHAKEVDGAAQMISETRGQIQSRADPVSRPKAPKRTLGDNVGPKKSIAAVGTASTDKEKDQTILGAAQSQNATTPAAPATSIFRSSLFRSVRKDENKARQEKDEEDSSDEEMMANTKMNATSVLSKNVVVPPKSSKPAGSVNGQQLQAQQQAASHRAPTSVLSRLEKVKRASDMNVHAALPPASSSAFMPSSTTKSAHAAGTAVSAANPRSMTAVGLGNIAHSKTFEHQRSQIASQNDAAKDAPTASITSSRTAAASTTPSASPVLTLQSRPLRKEDEKGLEDEVMSAYDEEELDKELGTGAGKQAILAVNTKEADMTLGELGSAGRTADEQLKNIKSASTQPAQAQVSVAKAPLVQKKESTVPQAGAREQVRVPSNTQPPPKPISQMPKVSVNLMGKSMAKPGTAASATSKTRATPASASASSAAQPSTSGPSTGRDPNESRQGWNFFDKVKGFVGLNAQNATSSAGAHPTNAHTPASAPAASNGGAFVPARPGSVLAMANKAAGAATPPRKRTDSNVSGTAPGAPSNALNASVSSQNGPTGKGKAPAAAAAAAASKKEDELKKKQVEERRKAALVEREKERANAAAAAAAAKVKAPSNIVRPAPSTHGIKANRPANVQAQPARPGSSLAVRPPSGFNASAQSIRFGGPTTSNSSQSVNRNGGANWVAVNANSTSVKSNGNVFQQAKGVRPPASGSGTSSKMESIAAQHVSMAKNATPEVSDESGAWEEAVSSADEAGAEEEEEGEEEEEEAGQSLSDPDSAYSQSEDEDVQEKRAGEKPWERAALEEALRAQANVDPDGLFGIPKASVPLENWFETDTGATPAKEATKLERIRRPRTSSGTWNRNDLLGQEEIDRYNRMMGIKSSGVRIQRSPNDSNAQRSKKRKMPVQSNGSMQSKERPSSRLANELVGQNRYAPSSSKAGPSKLH
ncbi:hypothetical protein CBOM_00269 [Ceraceosorus bombacis]|uniref:Inner centromere protein ARK-binding domain-containing protein n=1 Tax=Ceraceosorus bombacis TaxID=401625 RepID=A0A0P1BAC0_9BASI|nr:hypothetical protein CBOM_00269 [Ceraceosorus bombacis]